MSIKDQQKKILTDALWASGNLKYKLHSAQLTIYSALRSLPPSTREALLLISRRFGKSYLAVVLAMEDAIRTGKTVLLVGPSEKQIVRIATPLINAIAADAPEGFVQPKKSEKLWKVGPGTVMIGGYDTASESFRGLEFVNIYFEEAGAADDDNFEYILYSVLFPTLMHTKGKIVHLGTPSPKVDHPLHSMLIPKTKKLKSFFTFTIDDNPLLSDADIEAEIETMGGRDNISVRRELFCEIVRDDLSSLVPEFSAAKFVREISVPTHRLSLICGDVGGVRDHTVIHLIGSDEYGRIVFIDECAFPPKTSTRDMVQQALEMEKRNGLSVNSITRRVDTPGQMNVDLASTYGYPVLLPSKKSFEATIAELRKPFRDDNIIISPKCELLIATLENGSFNKQGNDFARNSYLGHMDAAASAVYGIRHYQVKGDPRSKPNRESTYTTPRKDFGLVKNTINRIFTR